MRFNQIASLKGALACLGMFAAAPLAAADFGMGWPAPFVWRIAPDGEAERRIDRRVVVMQGPGGSFLGIGVQEITSQRAKELGLKEEYGVEITRVEDNSPASKAGLQKGDVVLEYNGQRVEGTEQFIRLVRETPVGRTVKLLVFRNGSTQTLTATTEARKGRGREGFDFRFEMPEIRIPDMPRAYMGWRSATIGVEAESLDSQLAEFFGVKEGVLVRSVVRGSPAEKAGIKAGDVIVKVDGQKVASPRDIQAALRSKRSQESVPLTIVRERKEMNVSVTIEDARPPRPPAPPARRVVRDDSIKM